MSNALNKRAFAALGALLRYPGNDLTTHLVNASAILQDVSPEAYASFERFHQAIATMDHDTREECFTRTFDITPQCVPYLSVYLFGEDSFKRSQLMMGLLSAYERKQWDLKGELPDHLALVLQFAPHFDPEEWVELTEWCLTGPVTRMVTLLEKKQNPYVHLLRAVQSVLQCSWMKEAVHG